MNELQRALWAAGAELERDYSWNVHEGGEFLQVMTKHLLPIMGEGWREARIAALQAEIEMLKGESR